MDVFQVESAQDPELIAALSDRFLEPIFSMGHRYPDSLPALDRLRSAGFRTGIVSNTPWGSPAHLWRRELARLELQQAVDVTVFCSDVGWRKPAKAIFGRATELLNVAAHECLFVGDDVRWDFDGACGAGMAAVLLDRDHRHADNARPKVHNLEELVAQLLG